MKNEHKHGGARPGAGRPRKDPNGAARRRRAVYCTDEEYTALQNKLSEIRWTKLREQTGFKAPCYRYGILEYDNRPFKQCYTIRGEAFADFYDGIWDIQEGDEIEYPHPSTDGTTVEWTEVWAEEYTNGLWLFKYFEPGISPDHEGEDRTAFMQIPEVIRNLDGKLVRVDFNKHNLSIHRGPIKSEREYWEKENGK